MPAEARVFNHDFEGTIIESISFEEAVSLLKRFDWDAQYHQYCEKLELDADVCPPSITFTDDESANRVSIRQETNDGFSMNLVMVQRQPRFGLLSRSSLTIPFSVSSLDEAIIFLEVFYRMNLAELEAVAKRLEDEGL